jgi:uncharacterized membrane protein (UPF0127 family)
MHLTLLTFGIAASLSCENEAPPPPDYSVFRNFLTTEARVITSRDTVVLQVKVAQPDDARDLRFTDGGSLPDGSGILFGYNAVQDSTSSFSTYRSRIPLETAFLDSAGKISSITSMVPCNNGSPYFCPLYPSSIRFSDVLVTPAGYFERAGIRVGDRVHAYIP